MFKGANMSTLLKKLRRQREETVYDVAAATGTNAGNISRIENGQQKPSLALAERLAKHFGYAITEIQLLYPERFQNGEG